MGYGEAHGILLLLRKRGSLIGKLCSEISSILILLYVYSAIQKIFLPPATLYLSLWRYDGEKARYYA